MIFNWKTCFEKRLEEDPDMWNLWTTSDKRYLLICYLNITKNDINAELDGQVTGNLECHISSNQISDLKLTWESNFIRGRYDTTRQHFIVDVQDKKVIEVLSGCT